MRETHAGSGRSRVASIDGLRALAIMAIVVYHAKARLLPGGFLGVTVFFVLTGYLTTRSILRRRDAGSVGPIGWLGRRVRRLWPSMALVVSVTAILSAALLPPALEKMRGDVLPALAFFENWWFVLREQSYFAAAGVPSPITHLWYLSVVMQFCVVWPPVLLALLKVTRSRKAVCGITVVLALASSAWMAVLFDPATDPSRVYYGLDTRAAELLVGAALACGYSFDRVGKGPNNTKEEATKPARRGRGTTLFVGMSGLVSLTGLVTLSMLLDGYAPLLYRGGLLVAAMLAASVLASIVTPGTPLSRLLALRPLVTVGRRAYQIYLWHYPLLLLMWPPTRTSEQPWWMWVVEALVILAVSEVSYRLLEMPRKPVPPNRRGTPRGRHAAVPERVMPTRLPVVPRTAIALVVVLAVPAAVLVAVGPVWAPEVTAAMLVAQQQGIAATSDGEATDAGGAAPGRPAGDAAAADVEASAPIEEASPARPDTAIEGITVNDDGTTDCRMLLIGDSVGAGAAPAIQAVFPNALIDAAVSRQLYTGQDFYAAHGDYDADCVVFELGSNGVAREEQVRTLLEAVHDKPVYLVTVRVPYPMQDMNNELFARLVPEYAHARLVDWHAVSEGHDEYLVSDGTHLTDVGAEAYALMLRRAIAGE